MPEETGYKLSEEDKQLLDKVGGYQTESADIRLNVEQLWTDAINLVKGRFSEGNSTTSAVRNKKKTFFRKTWAIKWRFMASMHQAFLRDLDSFKIEGRDTFEDPHKAAILQIITEWRRDGMMRSQGLFKKLMGGFSNIFDFGSAPAKMSWGYIPERGKDGPIFKLWPNEQFYPDFSAETKDEMRYVIFESYMFKEQMEELKYDNIEHAQPTGMPQSSVRNAKYQNATDPLQNPKDTEYPPPGKYEEGEKDVWPKRYKVWEIFYKENGKMKFTVTNERHVVLKQPVKSPYGNNYDMVIIGECLLLAHMLLGEDFPNSMKSSQESYNYFLNKRKDNIALLLDRMKYVSRWANVDTQSLLNKRAGGIVQMDDVTQIKEDETPDVTQSAYSEAASDDQMMQEISGFTPPKTGQIGESSKATVARINFAEANAKIELYIAIVGETFIKDFFSTLASLIQRFETNETVFAIANDTFRQQVENPFVEDVYNLDFEANCILNAGASTVSRELDIQQLFLAMDRANMSNQSAIQLLQIGAQPPEGVEFFNTNYFLEKALTKMGQKDFRRAIFRLQAPPQQEGGGGLNPSLAGLGQPQIGGGAILEQTQGQGRETI
jgi:hypothetical protein